MTKKVIFEKIFTFFSKKSLIISILTITICFFIFYPTTYVSIDEYNYLQNSVNIVNGNLRQECTGDPAQYKVNGYCVFKYNIGTSFFFIPAALFNLKLGFLITFVTFCIGIIFFHKLLKHFGINIFWTYLYAFFPAFVYYSRTLFSETFSATLMVAIFYFLVRYQKDRRILFGIVAGMFAGMSVLVRYTNALPLAVLFLGFIFVNLKRDKILNIFAIQAKKLLPVIIGGLPFLFFFLYINNYLYAHPLRSGYFFSKEQGLYELGEILFLLPRYLGVLTILYPGMLILSFLSKNKYRATIFVMVFVLILFYSGFPGNSGAFEGRILDLIFGARFLMPILPFLIFLYVDYLDKFIAKKYSKAILLFIIIFLMTLGFALSYIHQDFLSGFEPYLHPLVYYLQI